MVQAAFYASRNRSFFVLVVEEDGIHVAIQLMQSQ